MSNDEQVSEPVKALGAYMGGVTALLDRAKNETLTPADRAALAKLHDGVRELMVVVQFDLSDSVAEALRRILDPPAPIHD